MSELFAVNDPLTLRLALLTGGLLVFSAIGMLDRKRAEMMLRHISVNTPFAHTTGALTFAIGAGIALFHLDVSSLLAALVTVTALWWAIEGAALLAIPHLLPLGRAETARSYILSNILALVVGLTLIAGGTLGLAGVA